MADRKPEPVLPADLILALSAAVKPVRLSGARKDSMKRAILERVERETRNARADAFTTVRAASLDWSPLLPGAQSKVLFDDGRVRTWMVRMSAGACIPAHGHAGDEEIVVLEGECYSGSEHLVAGDFHRACEGTWHEEMTTPTKCVLLIRSRSRELRA